ncbi:MAG: imidazolonepropionase [Anaerolineae bacterium]|nr:imidazolonepropionase [Anaerolineae bacterium]MDQ7035617.1 imidazolonepropionase [Anaerolineae bacterium]
MQQVELLIVHAAQLVTCASSVPKRGTAMRDVGLIVDGAVAVQDGRIVAVDTTDALIANYESDHTIDVSGKVVCPSFVDPHTHLVYAGKRLDEFEQRIQGTAYLDILKAGGGILSTVHATRAASVDELVESALKRLDIMLKHGTTTVEIKTGYGLDTETEMRMLQAIERLHQEHRIDIVPTFLAAHAIPPEYRGQLLDYVELIVTEMLPMAAEWYQNSTFKRDGIPFFIDIFCEEGAFDIEATRKIFDAGRQYGLELKAHVDEFVNLGGARLSSEMGATSIDHLDHTSDEEIVLLGQSDSVAVVIPAVNFNLGSCHFAPARQMIDANVALALTTDANPGSAPCYSMPMVMAIACRYQKLLPAETLNASTINAAHALRLAGQVGSIEIGKRADLLIMDTGDYRDIAYQFGINLVQAIFKDGKQIV